MTRRGELKMKQACACVALSSLFLTAAAAAGTVIADAEKMPTSQPSMPIETATSALEKRRAFRSSDKSLRAWTRIITVNWTPQSGLRPSLNSRPRLAKQPVAGWCQRLPHPNDELPAGLSTRNHPCAVVVWYSATHSGTPCCASQVRPILAAPQPKIRSTRTVPGHTVHGWGDRGAFPMSFDSLGLSAALLRSVAEQGYTQPTPVQAQVIPVVLQTRDVMAGAQTGTGKTAGFTLPMLELLSATPVSGYRHLRALILTPTRELAAQVAASVQTYGKYLPLKSTVVFGGVSINPQTATLRRGVDILDCDAGTSARPRVGKCDVDFSHESEILVLDEADRMLDMGFLPDIRRIIALLPSKRQNLLFSATFPDDIRTLANKMLSSPMRIEVASTQRCGDIQVEQIVHLAEKNQKRGGVVLADRCRRSAQLLVFTRTKHGANRLAQQLEQDGLLRCGHSWQQEPGRKNQSARELKKARQRPRSGCHQSPRASLDIDQLPHVVNLRAARMSPSTTCTGSDGPGARAARESAVSLVSGTTKSRCCRWVERLLGHRSAATGHRLPTARRFAGTRAQPRAATPPLCQNGPEWRPKPEQPRSASQRGRTPALEAATSAKAASGNRGGAGGKSRAGRRRRGRAQTAAGRP